MQIHTVPVFGSLAYLASVTAEAVHTSSAQCCDERRTLTLNLSHTGSNKPLLPPQT